MKTRALWSARWWNALAVVTVTALLYLNVTTARTAIAPRAPWDEIAPLQMARLLAGVGPLNRMSVPGYYPGWGILLTPVWWVTQDPRLAYRIAIGVVIALAMATVLPLAALAKRCGLHANGQAVTAAALTLCLPARTVNADYALSENLLAFLVACTILTAFWLWDHPNIPRLAVFTLATTACYLTHVRALVVMLAAGVWLVLFSLRDWRIPVVGLPLLVAGYATVEKLVKLVAEPIMLGRFLQSDRLLYHLRYLSSVPRTIMQQGWAQMAGSFGVIAIGFFFAVMLTWQELRMRRMGPHGFARGLFIGAAALSVLAMFGPLYSGRFDIQVYTRYLDPFAMVIVLYGIVAVFRKAPHWVVYLAGACAVANVLFICLRTAPWSQPWGTMDGPANSAAVLGWARHLPKHPFTPPLLPGPSNGNAFWFWGSVSIIVGLLAILLLRRFPKLLSALLTVAFVWLAWEANPSQSRDYPRSMNTAIHAVESTAGKPTGTLTMDFDLSCRKTEEYDQDAEFENAVNWSGYWFLPRSLTPVDPTQGGTFHSDVVISCASWPQAKARHALAVKDSRFETYQLWVLPGSLQNALLRASLLE